MTKNDHFETQNIIFERFWPLSKFHFPACSTLIITTYFVVDFPRCFSGVTKIDIEGNVVDISVYYTLERE